MIHVTYKGEISIDDEEIGFNSRAHVQRNPAELDTKDFSFRKVGQCPIMDILKPLDDGIILGWTTIKEAISLGGKYSKCDNGYSNIIEVNGRTYWDFNGDGIIEDITIDKKGEMPNSWSNIGLSFSMSYNQWNRWLVKNGFSVNVTEEPREGIIFRAKMEAEDLENGLKLSFDFSQGKGSTVSDKYTLYSITLKRKRIVTSTTDYTPYLPVVGVTIGQTKRDELPKLSNSGSKGDKYNYNFYLDNHNIVDCISFFGNSLPIEWEGTDYYGEMTYNKWIRFFNERGFIITKNEPLYDPTGLFPELNAVHPYYGIKVEVIFNRSINALSEGNLSGVFLLVYIRLV
jgi:hypothetical protein